MSYFVIFENVKKSFNNIKALDNVSISISKGELCAFLGPDGAGKSTFFRSLCGIIDVDDGNIILDGINLKNNKKEVQSKIGYLSQNFSLYTDLTVSENIDFFATIHNKFNYRKKKEELLRKLNLYDFRDRLAKNLSGGMKQKLALICSLIYDPEILILDEPTNGVDPVSRREFWNIIIEQNLNNQLTILISTPYLDEAELADTVVFMNKGKILFYDSVTSALNLFKIKILKIFAKNLVEFKDIIPENLPFIIYGDRIELEIKDENQIKELIENFKLRFDNFEYEISNPSLENIFVLLLKEENNNYDKS